MKEEEEEEKETDRKKMNILISIILLFYFSLQVFTRDQRRQGPKRNQRQKNKTIIQN